MNVVNYKPRITYNVPSSLSVAFQALDLIPTNLLLMLFSAKTRVQLALSSNGLAKKMMMYYRFLHGK